MPLSKTHTDREYENQLTTLRERLLLMTGRVEEMIADSVRALVRRDEQLARETIEKDHHVNRDEMECDQMCLTLLARRQPMGSDLRFITLALKMVTDLERIGDLAVNICERVIDLMAFLQLKPYQDIPLMADRVQKMLREASDAFVNGNESLAEQVIAQDDEVDRLYDQVFSEILEIMRNEPATLEPAIHVQSVIKYLERIADHATNLAEEVIYMLRGRDVRHAGKLN
ncbi:MAG: phosphate signaling complex protein PhoU [Myxococcales bacterium]|nr:phosphate signaling complex protein PhoU [Myxococcales bacterium]